MGTDWLYPSKAEQGNTTQPDVSVEKDAHRPSLET